MATDLFAPKLRPVTTVVDLNGGQVEPGDVLRYTTTGTNVGTDTAANVTVTQNVPAEFELLQDTLNITNGAAAGPQTPAGGDDRTTWEPASRTLTWRLGTGASVLSTGGAVGVNESFTFTYDVRVGAPANGSSAGGPATSEYKGDSTGYPFKLTGTGGSISVAGPDLAMDLTRTGALVRGETATYHLSVKNVGAAPTVGPVQVVDELPAGLELAGTAAGSGWTCEAVGQRVTCDRSDVLAVDESYPSITIPVRVRQSADSSLVNAATVSGGSDGVHSNDSDADTATLVSKSDLEVEQSHGTAPIVAGTRATFTTQVTNTGPSDASDVIITQPIPEALTGATAELRSATGTCAIADGVARCTIPALAVGERVVLVLSGHVPSSAAGAQLFPTATANSHETDPDPADNEATDPATVIAINDLAVTAKAPTRTIRTGQQATVQLIAINNGPSDAT